jgi:hypothetical protein
MMVAALLVYPLLRQLFFALPLYQSRAQRDFRQYRFPSIEDRVKLYMGDWYLPPCNEDGKVDLSGMHRRSDTALSMKEISMSNATTSRAFSILAKVEVSILFYFHKESLKICSQRQWPIGPYCSESLVTIEQAKSALVDWDDPIPILLQFGDQAYTRAYAADTKDKLCFNPLLPHIKKFRLTRPKPDPRKELVLRTNPLRCIDMTNTRQPIVWKLNAKRHYRNLYLVPRNDRSWSQKTDTAVFRGAATGNGQLAHGGVNQTLDCLELPRCQLVYQYASSKLVDAKLTKLLDRLPPVYRGVRLTAAVADLSEMLAHKGILILEGNDVSSGLKWALLSQSVVLMPAPEYTSWAMEELLEPWMHYIPLKSDLSNVEEMVQWMLDHPAEAQRISQRATLWIMDLVFHPDSETDDRQINQEILKRYSAYFKL